MSITKISSTRNVGGLLRYVLEDKAHNGSDERYISATANNCTIYNARSDFKYIRDRYDKHDNVQGYSIVISWDKEELSPDDPDDIEKAQHVAHNTALAVFGEERQFVVVLQRDGTGGNLHAHCVGSSIDMKTGKSLRGAKTGHKHLKNACDNIQRELNILNKNEQQSELTDKQTIKEIKARDKGTYVWKDDLKQRVYNCMYRNDVNSYDDFKRVLKQEYNVEVVERKSKKQSAYNGYILTYKFKDKSNKERKARETALGTVLGLKGLDNAIKQKIQLERQRQIEHTRQQQLYECIRADNKRISERDTEREREQRRIQEKRIKHLEDVRDQLQREYKQQQRDRQR